MKTFIAAAGLALAANCQIEDTLLGDVFTDLGLTKEQDQINLDKPMESGPKVQAFGFDSTLDPNIKNDLYSSDGNWGMDIGLNLDIGAYYELPVYN